MCGRTAGMMEAVSLGFRRLFADGDIPSQGSASGADEAMLGAVTG
ncbi:hypothetical protein [Streptomyces sp. NPDC058731]